MPTPHYTRVKEFMLRARQDCPAFPTMPDVAVRRLRARLLLEEALEQIKALGFRVDVSGHTVTDDTTEIVPNGSPDLLGVIDGCADVSVINTGTLIAFGIDDEDILRGVDANNLAKFGPGHSVRADGKLVKPPGHPKPDFANIVRNQFSRHVADGMQIDMNGVSRFLGREAQP